MLSLVISMVTGTEAVLSLLMSKKVVARYQNLKIPYERNKETNIRGHFMTASPGIDFDPDFEDEDIIIDVTPITPTE